MWHDFRYTRVAETILTDQNSDADDGGNTAHQQPMTGRKTMQFKSILAAAGIAVAATVGLATAADRFATLDGIAAGPMTAEELSKVRGAMIISVSGLPTPVLITDGVFNLGDGKLTVKPLKAPESLNVDIKVGFGPVGRQ